jgi:NADH-quinone oxidoreductase subunit M
MSHLLSLVTFLPLAGVGIILCLSGSPDAVARNARWVALWTSLIVFVLSVFLWTGFDSHAAGFQFTEIADWVPAYHIAYHVGIDGISLFFVLLATLLTPLCIIVSWDSIKVRVRDYMIALLVLETMMVGSFVALDFLLFYFFFEGVLLPTFLLISVWGGPRRVQAAFKFFLYSLVGSVLMLLAILAIAYHLGTTDITVAMTSNLSPQWQFWLWLAFFASFAIKIPMWPVHTWLLDATVEAPTAATVLIAAVLHKMGAYGLLRFLIPVFPEASAHFAPFVFGLSVIAVIYTSLVALAQEDMKRLIAYSSVAHMGFVTIGVFTLSQQGVQGALIQMLSHGIVVGALFLCAGVLIDRLNSREIGRYGGLAYVMPGFALVFMIFTLASVGLPGTSGFIGEFLVLLGAFEVNRGVALLTTTSVILVVCYMLVFYRRIVFGTLAGADLRGMLDLSWRERLVFAPLLLLVFWIGLYPSSFLEPMHPAVTSLIARGISGVDRSMNAGLDVRVATLNAKVLP